MTSDRTKLLATAAAISLLVGAAVMYVRSQSLLEPLELIAYDLGFVFLPGPDAPPRITLIAITESDIAELGTWPVPDARLAEGLRAVAASDARVIGLDVYRDVPVPPGTAELEALFAAEPRIVGIYKFGAPASEGVPAPPVLAEAGRAGFSDMVLDPGGIVRRGLAFVDDGETVGTAFSLMLTLAYLERDGIGLEPDSAIPEHFKLGNVTFAPLTAEFGGYRALDAGGYQFLIDFTRRPSAFETFSFADLVAGRVPRSALDDRVVIIGVNAMSVKDSFGTPLGQWGIAPESSGIALHAQITDQLLRAALDGDTPMASMTTTGERIAIMLAALLGGFAGLFSRSANRLFVLVAAGTTALVLMSFAALVRGLWVPVVPMLAGALGSVGLVTAYLVQRGRRERDLLQRILSLQVSKEVADALWERRDELLDEGALRPQALTATVMFTDLKGFTGLSEALPPEALLEWLRPFLDVATQTIIEHGGMVDDYFGDGIKSNFGVPLARTTDAEVRDDAKRAVRCAAALVRAAHALNSPERPPYRLRIGIHTGTVVSATVGSKERSKYTSLGDTVNVAARLEAHAKDIAPSSLPEDCVLVSDATARLLDDEFTLTCLGDVALKGKAATVTVFRVLLDHPEIPHVTDVNGEQRHV